MGASQSEITQIGLAKGQGLRITSIRQNSPLDGKVQPFFDFIVDAMSNKQPESTPKQILGKLTNQDPHKRNKRNQNFKQFIQANQNTQITLKIVSTKFRNIRNVQITPNRNWNGSEDLIGIMLRKQRYDEAYDTYFPFASIQMNSPIKKAGIMEGQFLIGCREFVYRSNNQMLENVYDRFYDKQISDKTIHLAIYNLKTDDLRIVSVLLARGWGDKGLLGCQFLEGQLNKFPKNLLEKRQQLLNHKKLIDNELKIKQQLSESLGTSEQLVESLKSQRNKRKNHLNNIKNILLVQPPKQSRIEQPNICMPADVSQKNLQTQSLAQPNQDTNTQRINTLELRVTELERTIFSLKEYIEKISEEDEL